MTMTLNDRVFRFEGIENFRDYGGYATRDGARIVTGQLYRSPHHGGATAADRARLDALGLNVLIDLRKPAERSYHASPRPANTSCRVFEIDEQPDNGATAKEFLKKQPDLGEAAIRTFAIGYYRGLPFEGAHRRQFAVYFRELSTAAGPTLIHCTSGKDRTGVLSALTHHVLGVHDDDLMADFVMSNDLITWRSPTSVLLFRQMTGQDPTDEALRLFNGVLAEQLHAAWAAMAEAHGSVDGYLEQVLGVDDAMRDRLRARLLA